jgi:putative addiction module killer protein
MHEIFKTASFDTWLRNLRDRHAAARVQARIDRLAVGNHGEKK